MNRETSEALALFGFNSQGAVSLPACAVNDPRFLLQDSFEITVPDDYVHDTAIEVFRAAHGNDFSYLNTKITDAGFCTVTDKLVAGQKVCVEIYGIAAGGSVSSDDSLKFLRSVGGLLVGAQGAALVWALGRDKLPVNKWCVSYDEENTLIRMADGKNGGVPSIHCGTGDESYFSVGRFSEPRDDEYFILCFRNVS